MTRSPEMDADMRDTSAEDPLDSLERAERRNGLRHSIRPRRVNPSADDSPLDEDVIEDAVEIGEPEPSMPVYQLKRPLLPAEPAPEEDKVVTLETATRFAAPVVPEPDLPRWHELTKVQAGSRLGRGPTLPVVDAERESLSARAFDLLRTRLRQTAQEHGWSNIAITAPTSGCGTTFTAVNLALSLSRVTGSSTVLMDFNLRKPGVAQALEMRPRGSMSDFLHGQSMISDHMVRLSDTLAIGLNNAADDTSSETLQTAETAHTLERMRAALQPDLVIYDLPAMLAHDDVAAFMPHIDAVLLVSDGTQTMSRELMECERRLEGRVPLLGVVLNRARNNSIKRYT